MDRYSHKDIEKKWQEHWRERGMYTCREDPSLQKQYVLNMFPYPSGAGLHVGHAEGYVAADIYARFKRMKGFDVLYPMGWDAFGLPAENFAVKTGVHPKETTEKAIANFKRQLQELGLSYDWSRELGTHTSEYYKWTQWFFLLLYRNGLAYKAKANVNWCDSCKTVLANEQVEQGRCERCKSQVVQKELAQWFFKITEYTEDLLEGLEKVDWPESTKTSQRNWIGRSEGAILSFPIRGFEKVIEAFTTRPDTLFGATYMVLAPDHPLVDELKEKAENAEEVLGYVEETRKKTELERTAENREKTGVELKGVKAVNPGTKEEIPVFIADYVLAHYGTGAIMAVPAHDERDFEFATKHGLSVRCVISPGKEDKEVLEGKRCYKEIREGDKLVNSGPFNGMHPEEAKPRITEHAGGRMKTTYRLRDWLVSRQRYWGSPIPIVYDPEGKAHPIPEEHLPWHLPSDVEFKPTGVSPLAQSKELQERTERIFGKGWRPEVDTMDTFVCSSWYYFRFTDPHNEREFASKEKMRRWLPVDLYVGGAEHAVLHLLYARFFTKILHKLGYISFDEPFLTLRHQGTILGPDGQKMSKSKGNIVNPDHVLEEYGADSIRLYEMFMGSLEDMKPWATENIAGVHRFLHKVWNLQERVSEGHEDDSSLTREVHETVKKAGKDIETMDFNTAISKLMICANAMEKEERVSKASYEIFLKVLAPFAPHIAEELWHRIGNRGSVHEQEWPSYEERLLEEKVSEVVVQVNGKVRGRMSLAKDTSKEEAERLAREDEHVRTWLENKKIRKTVFIPSKLLNIVTD